LLKLRADLLKNITMNRRNLLKIIGINLPFLSNLAIAKTTNLHRYYWNGIFFGNPAEMIIISESKNKVLKLINRILVELNRLEKVFYLQRNDSQINQLNKNKILYSPDSDLVNAIRLSEKFYSISKGTFDITVQPLWNAFIKEKKPNLLGIGFQNIEYSNKIVLLSNKNTEITLNAIAQDIITDRINEIILNNGINNCLINFGEGKGNGIDLNNKKWKVKMNDIEYEIQNNGFSYTDPKSTLLPNGKHHLFNALDKDSSKFSRATAVIAKSATLADILSTTYSISDNLTRNKIKKAFPKANIVSS